MMAMGYMPKVTAKAAKEVAMNAGARVLEVASHDEPAEFRLDRSYLLYAIGLLGKKHPDQALNFARRCLEMDS